MMWEYFFPEEEQDSQRRQVSLGLEILITPFVKTKVKFADTVGQNLYWGLFIQEVWKVSTTAGARRVKKGSLLEASASNSHSIKETEASSKSGISAMLFPATSQLPVHAVSAQVSI